MKMLYLAPQPMYQERGTSIANKLALEVLAQRGEDVDLLAYHEGEDFTLPGLRIFRTPNLPFIRNIRPGFSLKKLVCDAFMLPQAFGLALRNRYDMVHAVEESVFIALLLKLFLGIPYTYDMDSSIAQQMIEKYGFLGFMAPVFNAVEGLAIRHAHAVVVVCDALGDVARKQNPRKLVTLHDVPLIEEADHVPSENLRDSLDLTGQIVMYVGNLEAYQGIDLLLNSFARVEQTVTPANLVIIGGANEHIAHYQQMATDLGIGERVHFIGKRPVGHLTHYLNQADVLVSPRIKGTNTPMKVYSYLHSGTACLATDLWTHTQVLTDEVALLAAPQPDAFGAALTDLLTDDALRARLGAAGRQLIAEKYNRQAFENTLNELMDWLQPQIIKPQGEIPL